MDLRSLFAPLRRKFWLILLVAVIAGGTAFAWTRVMTRTVFVGELFVTIAFTDDQATDGYKYGNYYGNYASIEFARTASGWLSSEAFLSRVYDEARVDRATDTDLLGKLFGPISMERVERANIRMTLRSASEENAERLVAALRSVLSEQLRSYNDAAGTKYVAVNPEAKVSAVAPDPNGTGVLGFLAGLVLGVLLAYLVEFTRGVVASPEQASALLGSPVSFLLRRRDPTLPGVLASHIAQQAAPTVLVGLSLDPSGLARSVGASLHAIRGGKLILAEGQAGLRLGSRSRGPGWSDEAAAARGPVKPNAKLLSKIAPSLYALPFGRAAHAPVSRILGFAQIVVLSYPEGAPQLVHLPTNAAVLLVARLGVTRERDLAHARSFLGDRPVTLVLLT